MSINLEYQSMTSARCIAKRSVVSHNRFWDKDLNPQPHNGKSGIWPHGQLCTLNIKNQFIFHVEDSIRMLCVSVWFWDYGNL